jgi:NAD(P) transhydrogenase subunit alpha
VSNEFRDINRPVFKVWLPKEVSAGETRVAATPETIKRLVSEGLDVAVESGAGERACFSDERYRQAGARVTATSEWGQADLILKVAPLTAGLSKSEATACKPGATLIGLLGPHKIAASTVRELNQARITAFAMELVPRITRAQKMDALSSQGSIAGYKAVLRAADTTRPAPSTACRS